MSESTAIRVEGLGKQYMIGSLRVRHDTLRDQLGHTGQRIRAAGRRTLHRDTKREFWALRDVTFEIEPGSVVGLIGHNGAGKSTLLKILASITPPTEGRVELRGRIGSLLEVGTGFHGELTGRENVFLSGAIMGMRQAEIRRKFDDIVAFAEVEEFIETPVKRYSSGMYIRLAFAVAAFLEPEILLIDEVLAVGDARFQRKCIGQMGSVAREGRTVLLVSHNMGAVNQLCPTTIWLSHGGVRDFGNTREIVNAYLGESIGGGDSSVVLEANEDVDVQLRRVSLLDEEGRPAANFDCDRPIRVRLLLQVRRRVEGLYGSLDVLSAEGTPVLISYSYDRPENPLESLDEGWHEFEIVVPARTLAAGSYQLAWSASRGLKGTTTVESPGTVASFTLDDVTTLKGNRRAGYFSTVLDWTPVDHEPYLLEEEQRGFEHHR